MPAPSLRPMTSRSPDHVALPTGAAEARPAAPLPAAFGIEAPVGPLAPRRRHAVHGRRDDNGTTAFLSALIGPGRPSSRPAEKINRRWLRIAVVDALDRWLQLPVNGALIQTERAVARTKAAVLLGAGPVRAGLLDDAVSLARAAQPQLEGFLEQLALPVPATLRRRIRRLVDGVMVLATSVPDADDLCVVAKAGERALHARGDARSVRLRSGAWLEPCSVGDRGGDLLDPRLVPARVLRFSDDPALGEVRRTRAMIGGVAVLEVEVDAIGPHGGCDDSARDRLYARFVTTAAGSPRIHARVLLTYGPARDQRQGEPTRYVFTARLPLEEGVNPDHLSIEIVDAAIDRAPAAPRSVELIEFRRAVILLRHRRLLASCRRLGVLAEAERLRAGCRVSGDQTTMVEELDGAPYAHSAPADRRRSMAAGACAPLVAELAYAYETFAGVD
jgi:hypothetical protein